MKKLSIFPKLISRSKIVLKYFWAPEYLQTWFRYKKKAAICKGISGEVNDY